MLEPIVLTAALIIIGGLAVYAAVLVNKVKKMQAQQAKELAEQREKQDAQRRFIVDSIHVISANVIDEDLNLSEATIRCKMLLDALLLPEEERRDFQVLEDVFDQIQHFDTHDARKQLSSEERRAQDKERELIESRYQESLRECFVRLRQFQPSTEH